MTNENPISAIEALLAERQRYESWMATLETRREATPAHVYERVRTDYEARLKDVLERLGGRSGDLQLLVETLAGRVAALESDEGTRRDALAEAELRALVGEFEAEEWERLRAERDAEIQRLVTERGEVSGELQKVQQLLTRASAEPRFATPAPGIAAAPAPEPEPVPAPQAAEPAVEAPPAPVAAAPSPEPVPEPDFRFLEEAAAAAPEASPATAPAAAPGAAPASFDELAFLQSLGTESAGAAAAQARPAEPAPPAAPPRQAPMAEAARSLASDLAARPPMQTPADVPGQRTTSPAMRQMADPVPAPPRPAEQPRRSTDSVPSFLRDVPSEQVKTLKCQECGTMNYPTEWYCERCGGELAAM